MEPVDHLARAEWVSSSAEETGALGEALGALLCGGDVVTLDGDLGAGKTEFARGVCRGLGVPDDDIRSPTFAIVHRYQGHIPVTHADWYRIATLGDLRAIGFFDDLDESVALIEWANRCPAAVPSSSLAVLLVDGGGTRRRLIASANDASTVSRLRRWVAATQNIGSAPARVEPNGG